MSDSTHTETRRLNQDYPAGTVITYHGDTGYRSGLVVKAERGELLVQTPAIAARKRKSRWGVTVTTPIYERVTRQQIRGVSERYSKRKKEVPDA